MVGIVGALGGYGTRSFMATRAEQHARQVEDDWRKEAAILLGQPKYDGTPQDFRTKMAAALALAQSHKIAENQWRQTAAALLEQSAPYTGTPEEFRAKMAENAKARASKEQLQSANAVADKAKAINERWRQVVAGILLEEFSNPKDDIHSIVENDFQHVVDDLKISLPWHHLSASVYKQKLVPRRLRHHLPGPRRGPNAAAAAIGLTRVPSSQPAACQSRASNRPDTTRSARVSGSSTWPRRTGWRTGV
jgi:hypothetical protein